MRRNRVHALVVSGLIFAPVVAAACASSSPSRDAATLRNAPQASLTTTTDVPARAGGVIVPAPAPGEGALITPTGVVVPVVSKAEGGWTLMALIFTLVMVAIVISGSLWIMFHLNSNMMPMSPPSMPTAP